MDTPHYPLEPLWKALGDDGYREVAQDDPLPPTLPLSVSLTLTIHAEIECDEGDEVEEKAKAAFMLALEESIPCDGDGFVVHKVKGTWGKGGLK